MGRSRHLNVDCARSQEAYFAKIRATVMAWMQGEEYVTCPRETCEETVSISSQGSAISIQCPNCGLIYRGNRERLMEYYDI